MVNPWSFSAWANWSQKTLSSTIAHLSSCCLVFFKNDHPFLPPANEVWGKVIFLHQSVILSTGGVPGQVHPTGTYTPWASTPQGQVPPPGRYTPRAGTLPIQWFMHGQYASYWNAFLLLLISSSLLTFVGICLFVISEWAALSGGLLWFL